MRCGAVRCGAVRCDAMRCGVVWCCVVGKKGEAKKSISWVLSIQVEVNEAGVLSDAAAQLLIGQPRCCV